MKKKVIIPIIIIVTIIIAIVTFLIVNNKKTFYLENALYGNSSMIEIGYEQLTKLTDDKKSFAVFVYQPMCVNSEDFESVLSGFLEEKNMSIYKIAFSDIKNEELGKTIKYYPSFIIYKNGKIVDFLEADKDEDVDIYTSKKGFEDWFTKYVKLKKMVPYGNTSNEVNPEEPEKPSIEEIDLKDIVKEDDKVNIYFFWGNGCPRCEEQFEFLNNVKEKYGEYYNLYTFETWYDEDNAKLVQVFKDAMGDTKKGVPYTVIGSKSFVGFSDSSKSSMIDAIVSEHEKDFDVYFDKIKTEE